MLKLKPKETTKRMTVDIETYLLAEVKKKVKAERRTIREIIEAGLGSYIHDNYTDAQAFNEGLKKKK